MTERLASTQIQGNFNLYHLFHKILSCNRMLDKHDREYVEDRKEDYSRIVATKRALDLSDNCSPQELLQKLKSKNLPFDYVDGKFILKFEFRTE